MLTDAVPIGHTAGVAVVRRATEDDIPTIRALRLAALRDAPASFASTYEREAARTDEAWRGWLAPGAVFLLDVDDDPAGLVAVAPDRDGGAWAWLLAMWVDPRARRGGNGSRLVAAALAFAEAEWPDHTDVRLEVAADTPAAVALYQRHGFVLTDAVPVHRFDPCDQAMIRPTPRDRR